MLFRYLTFFILSFAACAAQASYPDRPLKIVIGYPVGGSVEHAARILAAQMEAALGQRVVVESRAGASGLIGAAAVSNSPPDGYTLYLGAAGTFTVTPFITKGTSLAPLEALTPLGGIASATNVLLVNKALPVRSLKELIDYARARPGVVTYGSSGEGTSSHLSGELLSKLTGTALVHIPYKGAAPAMADLLGGHIHMFFDVTATAQRYARHERITALGVTSRARNAAFPDLPTIAEHGYPQYEVTSWLALFMHASTPQAIADKLTMTLRAVQQDSAFKRQMRESGFDDFSLDREQLANRIKTEGALFSTLLKKE